MRNLIIFSMLLLSVASVAAVVETGTLDVDESALHKDDTIDVTLVEIDGGEATFLINGYLFAGIPEEEFVYLDTVTEEGFATESDSLRHPGGIPEEGEGVALFIDDLGSDMEYTFYEECVRHVCETDDGDEVDLEITNVVGDIESGEFIITIENSGDALAVTPNLLVNGDDCDDGGDDDWAPLIPPGESVEMEFDENFKSACEAEDLLWIIDEWDSIPESDEDNNEYRMVGNGATVSFTFKDGSSQELIEGGVEIYQDDELIETIETDDGVVETELSADEVYEFEFTSPDYVDPPSTSIRVESGGLDRIVEFWTEDEMQYINVIVYDKDALQDEGGEAKEHGIDAEAWVATESGFIVTDGNAVRGFWLFEKDILSEETYYFWAESEGYKKGKTMRGISDEDYGPITVLVGLEPLEGVVEEGNLYAAVYEEGSPSDVVAAANFAGYMAGEGHVFASKLVKDLKELDTLESDLSLIIEGVEATFILGDDPSALHEEIVDLATTYLDGEGFIVQTLTVAEFLAVDEPEEEVEEEPEEEVDEEETAEEEEVEEESEEEEITEEESEEELENDVEEDSEYEEDKPPFFVRFFLWLGGLFT